MSRSYRRPYTSISGVHSAKRDKVLAHRGMRRKQNSYLKINWDQEDAFLVPHMRDCHGNNVYDWSRDGKVRLAYELRHPERQRYYISSMLRFPFLYTQEEIDKQLAVDAEYFRRLYRK